MKTLRCAFYISGFIACLLAQQNAWALFGWGKLNVYSCKTEQDAMSCNARCDKQSTEIEFEINVDRSVVFAKVFESGALISSGALEKCSVANKNNWQCGQGLEVINNRISFHKEAMIDGTYYRESKFSSNPVTTYHCAKR